MAAISGPRLLRQTQQQAHPCCVVCSPLREGGLKLEFTWMENGSVEAHFDCAPFYEGFSGILHGGVVASLLDGAMTNCLFAHGHTGITGELKVRFCLPVVVEKSALVRGWIEKSLPYFYLMRAELIQEGTLKAKATAKFVEESHFAEKNKQVLVGSQLS